MFDDRRFEIPELEELRASLLVAADAQRPEPRRRSRRRLVIAVAAVAAVIVALAVLLSGDPLGRTIGVQEALGDIAARIELVPETPADAWTDTSYTVSTLQIFAPGYDRMMQPFEAFTAVSRLQFRVWLSRTKKGITRGHYMTPEYPTEKDRKIGERVLAANDKWLKYIKTPAGRRAYAPLAKRYMDWMRPRMMSNEPGSMFLDPAGSLAQEDEHGSINPDGMYHVGTITLTQDQVDAFPRDPRAGYDEVTKRMREMNRQMANSGMGIPPQPVEYLTWVALTQGAGSFNDTLPVDLRATFVAALQFLPGIRALGRQMDSTGRPGDAFEWESEGLSNRIVFDARTAIPLETSSTLSDPEKAANKSWRSLEKGTLINRWLLDEAKTVDSAPKR